MSTISTYRWCGASPSFWSIKINSSWKVLWAMISPIGSTILKRSKGSIWAVNEHASDRCAQLASNVHGATRVIVQWRFTDGAIWPSVNYLLIVILEQLIAMVTIRTQSQWIEPIKRGMKQTLCGHIVKIYVALEVLQQAPMEAILIALQPTLQGVIRHITICNHTLLFIGGSVLVS